MGDVPERIPVNRSQTTGPMSSWGLLRFRASASQPGSTHPSFFFGTREIAAPADRACRRSAGSGGHTPLVLALKASKSPLRGHHLHVTPFDAQNQPFNQHSGHLASSPLDDSAEGLAGNVHPCRCLLVVESFKVGQADGLKLIQGCGSLAASRSPGPPGRNGTFHRSHLAFEPGMLKRCRVLLNHSARIWSISNILEMAQKIILE